MSGSMTKLAAGLPLQVGQRIYTSLYSRGFGTVVRIHGEQTPGSVGGRCGIRVGGSAEFDIAFDCGQSTDRLPETILHGVQWTVLAEIVDAHAVAEAVARAQLFKAEQSAKKEEAERAFAAAVDALRTDPSKSHLKQVSESLPSMKAAAANIRATLKKSFPGVRFSVRCDHNSVRIRWTDGPTDAQVSELANTFKGGSFDGMSDCYVRERSPWTTVFGSADYISTSREFSDSLLAYSIEQAFNRFPDALIDASRPSIEDYNRGACWSVRVHVPGLWRVECLGSLIGTIKHKTEATAEGFKTGDLFA